MLVFGFILIFSQLSHAFDQNSLAGLWIANLQDCGLGNAAIARADRLDLSINGLNLTESPDKIVVSDYAPWDITSFVKADIYSKAQPISGAQTLDLFQGPSGAYDGYLNGVRGALKDEVTRTVEGSLFVMML